MNLFLSPSWLAAMAEQGAVSGYRVVDLAGEPGAVGEVRMWGQRQWVLYGAPAPPWLDKLASLFQQARAAGVMSVGCGFNMSRWPAEVVIAAGAEVLEPFGTYMLDLTQPREALWGRVHATHRRWIRRAPREGVTVRWGWEDDAFLALATVTYARGGKVNPISRELLRSLRRHLGENLLLAGAYHEEQLVAAVIIPWDSGCGYYLHGASRGGDGPVGAAHLLHWEVAERLRELGVARYDLGGARRFTEDARLMGIFQFKERFGGAFVDCCYWRKVVSPVRFGLHQVCARLLSR